MSTTAEVTKVENIDNVLEQLVLSGGEKIDWVAGESRGCPDNSWSIYPDTDCSHLEHLDEAVIKRLCRLDLTLNDDVNLQAIYDPETRRIEALDVYETAFSSILLMLRFWPGLESARKLAIATFYQWNKAIEDGWFERG